MPQNYKISSSCSSTNRLIQVGFWWPCPAYVVLIWFKPTGPIRALRMSTQTVSNRFCFLLWVDRGRKHPPNGAFKALLLHSASCLSLRIRRWSMISIARSCAFSEIHAGSLLFLARNIFLSVTLSLATSALSSSIANP